ncbi:MAG: hypothetical protein ABSG68_13325 [Thermoguttaceae bacterium]|jgi:hypothetical protein
MQPISRSILADNPFSACCLRPGALDFIFPPGQSVDGLLVRLRQSDWWGQITGGHGSGKSTLLAALLPAIQRAGRQTLVCQLHDGQRRLPPEFPAFPAHCPPAVLAIDGYEQLGAWSRFSLKRLCRRGGLGLLVTAHRSVGLPKLFDTRVDLPLACRVVEQMQRGRAVLVSDADVSQRFGPHNGNLRELLFELYDLYQRRC